MCIKGNDTCGLSSLSNAIGNGVITTAGQNPELVLFLPNETGAVSADNPITESRFLAKISAKSPAEVKEYQKLFGFKQTGSFSDSERNQILKAAMSASWNNYTLSMYGDTTGRKPDSIESFVAREKKNGRFGGSKTSTNISTQTTDFTDADSSNILTSFYESNIGRAPTAKEISNFTKVLNEKAKAKPNTVTTTTTTSGTTSRSNVTLKAGFGMNEAQYLAQQQAEKLPGSTGYVGATKYLDVIMSMIRNPVG